MGDTLDHKIGLDLMILYGIRTGQFSSGVCEAGMEEERRESIEGSSERVREFLRDAYDVRVTHPYFKYLMFN